MHCQPSLCRHRRCHQLPFLWSLLLQLTANLVYIVVVSAINCHYRNKVGTARAQEQAKLIDTFLSEDEDFIHKRGSFAHDYICVTAAEDDLKAYWWHQQYSLQVTKVLGKLACLVLSKILGIGMAEQNWKQVKAVKSGQRVNTSITKTTKQVLVYAQYQQARAQAVMANQVIAGKLWDDSNFAFMKMDQYCRDTEESL